MPSDDDKLAPEQWESVFSALRKSQEGGWGCPWRPPLIGHENGEFEFFPHEQGERTIPEFVGISHNLMDAFGVSLLSAREVWDISLAPALEHGWKEHVLRIDARMARMKEGLAVALTAACGQREEPLALGISTRTMAHVLAGTSRLLKGHVDEPERVFCTRANPCEFVVPYAGKLKVSVIPGLGKRGEDGEQQWPKSKLTIPILHAELHDVAVYAFAGRKPM